MTEKSGRKRRGARPKEQAAYSPPRARSTTKRKRVREATEDYAGGGRPRSDPV